MAGLELIQKDATDYANQGIDIQNQIADLNQDLVDLNSQSNEALNAINSQAAYFYSWVRGQGIDAWANKITGQEATLADLKDQLQSIVGDLGVDGWLAQKQQDIYTALAYIWSAISSINFSPDVNVTVNVQAAPTALGGIVTRPQFRLVGEAGPEAIIPLNQLSNSSSDSGTINNVTLNAPITIQAAADSNPAQIARETRRQLEDLMGHYIDKGEGRKKVQKIAKYA